MTIADAVWGLWAELLLVRGVGQGVGDPTGGWRCANEALDVGITWLRQGAEIARWVGWTVLGSGRHWTVSMCMNEMRGRALTLPETD